MQQPETNNQTGPQASCLHQDATPSHGIATSTATGSTITSNDLLYQTIYPSVAVGQPPSAVSNSYNALGQVISATDRNGNVHNYTYDNFGRQISDIVTTLGAGVDGSVLRMDTAYNNQGLAYLLTSYADTAGTQIVNQVINIYNGAAAQPRPPSRLDARNGPDCWRHPWRGR